MSVKKIIKTLFIRTPCPQTGPVKAAEIHVKDDYYFWQISTAHVTSELFKNAEEAENDFYDFISEQDILDHILVHTRQI